MSARHISFPEDAPLTRGEIATYYRERFGINLTREETRVPCPVHKGQGPNLSVNAETGKAVCHSKCQRGWDILGLERQLFGGSFPEVKRRVYNIIGRVEGDHSSSAGHIPQRETAAYDYVDIDGNLLYQNVRLEPGKNGKSKDFYQRRSPSEKKGGVKGIARVPFQLPLVAKASRVAVCEGERDCLALTGIGIVATTNAAGATHWTADEAQYLFGKEEVAIFGDNDEPGRKHVLVVARSLVGRVGSLRIVPVPAPHKDVRDWIEAGATAEIIRQAIADAPEYAEETGTADVEGSSSDWARQLIRNNKGQPRALLANAIVALRNHEAFDRKLFFNEFLVCTFVRGELPWSKCSGDRVWTNKDDLQAAEWLQQQEIHVSPDVASQAVEVVAGDRPFHPVREYLDSLQWDGVRRLDTWLAKYLGVAPSNYSYAVGKRWCISAVARIRKPGAKADCVLILEGPQGIFKSSAIETVAKPWFADEISDLGSKDSAMQAAGAWVIELSELDALSRGDVARIKAFISRTADRFRPPYGRRIVEIPRQCVFAGSVNGDSYLTDETGARRFWPVSCGQIDIPGLKRDRDQLWAEADSCYRAGEVWWLDSSDLKAEAETEQAARYAVDSWEDALARFCAEHDDEEIIVSKVLNDVFNISIGRQTRADSYRLGRALTKLRWTKFQKRLLNGAREWRYRLSPIAKT